MSATQRQPMATPRNVMRHDPGKRAPPLSRPASIRVLGVDACPQGWVGVELLGGVSTRAVAAPTLFEIVASASGAAAIGVDIPLGLLPDRLRAADAAAAA